jgi:hypothetical protein
MHIHNQISASTPLKIYISISVYTHVHMLQSQEEVAIIDSCSSLAMAQVNDHMQYIEHLYNDTLLGSHQHTSDTIHVCSIV